MELVLMQQRPSSVQVQCQKANNIQYNWDEMGRWYLWWDSPGIDCCKYVTNYRYRFGPAGDRQKRF